MHRVHCVYTLAILPFLAACGSSDEGSMGDTQPDPEMGKETMKPQDEPMPGELECDPNADVPCIEGLAEPCENIESGFPDDNYCRAVPDPSVGLQVHVGPSDYTDPDQIAKYVIYPGEETNWAEAKQSPNDELIYVAGYWSFMRPGSHHFIMYGSDQDPTGGQRTDTSGGGLESAVGIGGRFLGGATRAIQNITHRTEFPEDQGIGHDIPPRTWASMNLHFINVSEVPRLQEIWVNFKLIDEADVTQYIKPITWYGGLGMNIPPGTEQLVTNAPSEYNGGNGSECRAPGDLRIAMMTAHAHASTRRVTAKMNGETVLIEDYDWAEPSEWRFTRAHDNPVPDRVSGTSGAYTGLLEVGANDTFTWECDVHNEIETNLVFANRVYDGEMCMIFGYYLHPEPNQAPFFCAFF